MYFSNVFCHITILNKRCLYSYFKSHSNLLNFIACFPFNVKSGVANDPNSVSYMTYKIFATKIPSEAKFIDIVREIEKVGKISHITIKEHDEGSYKSAFIEYEDEETYKNMLSYCRSKDNSKFVSDDHLNDKSIVILDKKIDILEFKSREEILNKKKPSNKRNIALIYEGHIAADDEAAIGVDPKELKKRKKLWEATQRKILDTNYSVSPTRSCVFNVPEKYKASNIRKIFAVAVKKYMRKNKNRDKEIAQAGEKSVRIIDCFAKKDQPGVFFVEFTEHLHAKFALRMTNNNPEYFENNQRMIVMFALTSSYAKNKMRKKQEARKDALLKKQEKLKNKIEKNQKFATIKSKSTGDDMDDEDGDDIYTDTFNVPNHNSYIESGGEYDDSDTFILSDD